MIVCLVTMKSCRHKSFAHSVSQSAHSVFQIYLQMRQTHFPDTRAVSRSDSLTHRT